MTNQQKIRKATAGETCQLLSELFTAPDKPNLTEVMKRYNDFLHGQLELVNSFTGEVYNPAMFSELRFHTTISGDLWGQTSRNQQELWKDFDAVKVKQHMRQLIRLAKDVIDEVEKDNVDHVLICDMALEELDELKEQIRDAVLGPDPFLNDSSANQIKTGDASAYRF